VVSSVAPRDIGKASGTFSTMRQLGGAFGVAIGVAVFAAAGSYASPRAFSDGFVAAMGVAAGLALAGFVAALALPRRRRMADGPVAGSPVIGRPVDASAAADGASARAVRS
jgi:hypothetical protein